MYAKGGHGFGMNKQGLPTDQWVDRFGDWLQEQDLLRRKNWVHNTRTILEEEHDAR